MKSFHIACAAVAATGATLAAVALSADPDQALGNSYDRALNAAAPSRTALVAAAHGPGSEHFWLTQKTLDPGAFVPTRADAPAVTLADIKQAVATAGSVAADNLEIVGVQDIARAAIGAAAPAGRSLLVTARFAATGRQPVRIVRFVLDVDAGLQPPRTL